MRSDNQHVGAGAFPWVVMISVPATAFFTAIASETGKDAYKALERLVGRIYKARKAAGEFTGSVTFVDEETGTWINLPPDLPDDARRALGEIEWNSLPSAVLRWDRDRGRWGDAWDEFRDLPDGSATTE